MSVAQGNTDDMKNNIFPRGTLCMRHVSSNASPVNSLDGLD